MRLTTLSDPILLMDDHVNRSKTILRESCDGLTLQQRAIVEGIYTAGLPLIEASLTAQQIGQLFGEVEKSATAAGGNRTLLGKAVDIPGKVDDLINKVGKYLQDTTPVANFDAKFEKLKADASAKFPNLASKMSSMGEWAKENPGKTAAIVGVLSIIASLAGGPVGGAIAGQFLRGSVELLKGEKLSTAIGKGLKTAAYSFLAGQAFKYISDSVVDNIATAGEADLQAMEKMFNQENFENLKDAEFAKYGLEPGVLDGAKKIALQGNLNAFNYNYDVVLTPDQLKVFNNLRGAMSGAETFSPEYYGAAAKMHDFLGQVSNNAENIKLTGLWNGLKELPKDMLTNNQISTLINQSQSVDSLVSAVSTGGKAATAAIQGAIAAAGVAGKSSQKAKPIDPETKKKLEAGAAAKAESRYIQTRPLSEGQVYLMFNKVQQLDEGPLDWMKTKAGNLTTKITADKLNSAWKAAGAPTDSNEVAAFLTKQGVDSSIIDATYTAMKLPAPGTATEPAGEAPMDIEAVKKLIATLPTDRKARLLKFLMKAQSAPPTAPGAGAKPAAAKPAATPATDAGDGRIEPTMA